MSVRARIAKGHGDAADQHLHRQQGGLLTRLQGAGLPARACFAPNIECSNEPPQPPEPDDEEWAEAKVEIVRALKEGLAELGVEDD